MNTHRLGQQFPYTTEELAIYMNYICDQMQPAEEEEVKDNGVEPENNIQLQAIPEGTSLLEQAAEFRRQNPKPRDIIILPPKAQIDMSDPVVLQERRE